DGGGSFVDRGNHYRSAVFFHNEAQLKIALAAMKAISDRKLFKAPVATEIRAFEAFYPAENYHQDFYKKDPGRYYPYRKGSGRDAFIETHWKGVEPLVPTSGGS
ncbi:MAG: peptide-methionine (S)-S-oxide reductase, partial [Myxococcota bacterium]